MIKLLSTMPDPQFAATCGIPYAAVAHKRHTPRESRIQDIWWSNMRRRTYPPVRSRNWLCLLDFRRLSLCPTGQNCLPAP